MAARTVSVIALLAAGVEARSAGDLSMRGGMQSLEGAWSKQFDEALLNALGVHADSPEVVPLNIAEHMVSQAAGGSSSFVQNSGKQPLYKSYSTQSGPIFGILSQMLEEFEANLSEEKKQEVKAREDFEALSNSKRDQIAIASEKLDAMEEEHADNTKALSDAKEDIELTSKQRSADVEFLSNLRLTCQGLDKEWEQRSATRGEEIKAVSEALAVLTEDDARDHLAKTVTFLQEASDSEADSRARRSRAVAVLRKAARAPEFEADDLLAAWNSRRGQPAVGQGPQAQLSTLAVAAELDSFTEVKAAMDKMLADLKDQQKDEVAAKANCVKEFDHTEKATYSKQMEKKDLEGKLDSLASAISKLEDETKMAKEQMADATTGIKKASEAREKENAEFQTVVADQRATQTILKKALARLDLFYKKNKQALLQRSTRASQTPPVKFNKFKTNAGSSTAMSLIEQIVEDSQKLENEAMTGEKQAQADYESFVKDSNAVVQELQESVTKKSQAIAGAKVETADASSDHENAVAELESLAQYQGDLHQQCDFLLKNFEIRQRSRMQEMESIQQAKAFLSGAAPLR